MSEAILCIEKCIFGFCTFFIVRASKKVSRIYEKDRKLYCETVFGLIDACVEKILLILLPLSLLS